MRCRARFRVIRPGLAWASIGLLCAAALGPSPAAAEEPKAAAGHLRSALAAYQAQRFEQAAREFKTAYALDHDPKILFAWAQAERRLGHCGIAQKLYRDFLGTHPADRQVAAAKEALAHCASPSARGVA